MVMVRLLLCCMAAHNCLLALYRICELRAVSDAHNPQARHDQQIHSCFCDKNCFGAEIENVEMQCVFIFAIITYMIT